ncbi:MAG: hypothetical protein ABEJ95_03125 [Candidatus Nanohalobium sp.]
MVSKEKYGGEEAFKCEECHMHYKKEKDAEECEKHCREKGSCSTEVTKKSLERSRSG